VVDPTAIIVVVVGRRRIVDQPLQPLASPLQQHAIRQSPRGNLRHFPANLTIGSPCKMGQVRARRFKRWREKKILSIPLVREIFSRAILSSIKAHQSPTTSPIVDTIRRRDNNINMTHAHDDGRERVTFVAIKAATTTADNIDIDIDIIIDDRFTKQ